MDEAELINRIKNAIILLSSFHPLKVRELLFSSKSENHLSISALSNKNVLEDITRESAVYEITQIKNAFFKMVEVSNDLKKFIENKDVEFCLLMYAGMSDLEICTEINGKLNWHIEGK